MSVEKIYTNPPTPFSGPIPGGFSSGKMVRVQGNVPPNAQRFNVNLLCGSNPHESDVALHISVRILEGYIARNTCQLGEWGEEQGTGTLPIGPGQSFEIIVLADTSDFKIAVNGRHFCEFPQRIHHDKISHVGIDGDVTATLIAIEDNASQPGGPDSRSSHSSNFAGAPSAPGYGAPPPSAPYGQPYGPPQGAYGPPQGGYGPPPYGAPYGGPPPNAPGAEQESGYGDILDSAQSLIAGAIASGAAEKLLGGILGGGSHQNPQQQQAPPPPQSVPQAAQSGDQGGLGGIGNILSQLVGQPQAAHQPPQPTLPTAQLGGQGSIGGLGSIGSLLSHFAEEALAPKKRSSMPVPMPFPVAGPAPSFPPNNPHLSTPRMPPPPGIMPLPPSTSNNPSYLSYPPNPSSYSSPYPGPPNNPSYPPNASSYSSPYPRPPYPGSGYPHPPPPPGYNNHSNSNNVFGKMGSFVAPAAAAGAAYFGAKKLKKSKLKKALKYGLPIAGVGLGTYAISKAFKHSSSSSSSSSSDSD